MGAVTALAALAEAKAATRWPNGRLWDGHDDDLEKTLTAALAAGQAALASPEARVAALRTQWRLAAKDAPTSPAMGGGLTIPGAQPAGCAVWGLPLALLAQPVVSCLLGMVDHTLKAHGWMP